MAEMNAFQINAKIEDLKAGTEINGAHLKANRGTTIK